MVTPRSTIYRAASGAVVGGGVVTSLDPNAISFTWPPGPNCTIPAVAGVNAPLHPSVIDFIDKVPGGQWNGYRYWMAFTPYPLGNDDTQENPSVVASNDGDTWVAPATNPIVPAPVGTSSSYYNSDTHLLFEDGTLYCIYRLYDNRAGTWIEQLREVHSTDGVNWSAQSAINLQTSNTSSVSLILSPAIHKRNGLYWCWTYRRNVTPIVCELRTASSLYGPWSAPTLCTLALSDTAREPWHLDVQPYAGGWAMLIADRLRGGGSGRLWFAVSDMAGTSWSARSSAFSTASPNVYRSCMVRSGAGWDCWITDYDSRRIRRLRVNDTGA